MKKKIALIILATILLFSLSACGSKENPKITIATAGANGVYNQVGNSVAELLKDNGIEAEAKTTAGSAANLRLLSQGYVNFAIAQEDIANDAFNGTGTFSGDEAYKGYSAVAELYKEAVQIVVGADSGINSIADLKGKKISVGESDSGTERNAKQILDSYGIGINKYSVENMNYTEAATALTNGDIDAFFVTIGTNSPVISQLENVKLVSIDAAVINTLCEKYPFYELFTIPAGTYDNIENDVLTVGIKSILFASDSLSKSYVEQITALIFDNADKINSEVATELNITAPESSSGFSVAVHSGSESYFESAESHCKVTLSLDMYQSMLVAVVVLLIGSFLRKRVKFLRKFCIPAPVIGGLLFAILALVLYATKLVEFNFDDTLKNVCMVMFFTSVGFQANLKVLKSGGKSLIVFLVLVIALIFSQNLISVGLSKVMNIDVLVGMCTGSVPMVGGHGTSGAFGPVLEGFGVTGATTVCTAAATFGLVVGSLIGGPIGNRLITKNKLKPDDLEADDSVLVEDEKHHERKVSNYASAVFQMVIAIGIGTFVSYLLSLTGMTFPVYIGAMIVAAVMRNVGEYSGKINIHMGEINDLGGICLSLFLGEAMISLKLWQLADLALPLIVLLTAQTVFMFVFAYFIVFRIMGKNYDAAVIASGTCGFGMGATPNAMANMQSICDKYYPSVKAYLLIPIVGSLFADFINSLVVTFFINVL